MPQIQYKDPESEEIVSVDIDAGSPVITIGRNPGNIIRVNNPSISRNHAKIVWEANTCTLVDLGSSNGSYVNGLQIESQLLEPDDRLRVGEFPLDFVLLGNDPNFLSDESMGDILSSADVDVLSSADLVDESVFEPSNGFDSNYDEDSLSGISSISDISTASEVHLEEPTGANASEPEHTGATFAEEFVDNTQTANDVATIEPVIINDPEVLGEPVSEAFEISVADMIVESEAITDDPTNALELENLEITHDSSSAIELKDHKFTNDPTNALELGDIEITDDPTNAVHVDPADDPDMTGDLTSIPDLPLEAQASSPSIVPDLQIIEEPESPQIDTSAFELRIAELSKERDDLLDVLQSRAGDAGGAAKVQIDRLRSERDRLIEERRNLQRSQRDMRTQLDAYPPLEEIELLNADLETFREKDAKNQTQIESLNGELATKLEIILTLNVDCDEKQANIQRLEEEKEAVTEKLGHENRAITEKLENEKQAITEQLENEKQAITEQLENEKKAITEQLEDEKQAIIRQLEETISANTQLSKSLEDAQLEIQNAELVKGELEAHVSNLKSDGATSAERDQQQLSQIAQMEEDIGAKAETIASLEAEREELLKKSNELDALKEEHKSIQIELQARPLNEEVQIIVSDLAAAKTTIENNDEEISGLRIEKAELTEKLESAIVAQQQFDTRFNKQGKELAEVQEAYLALKKEKEAFARETDYLMGAKRNHDSEIRMAQKQVQELEKNDRRKKKIFDELRSDLEVLIGENTILQTNLDAMKAELEKAPSAEDLDASASLSIQRVEEIAGLNVTINELEDELKKKSALAENEIEKTEAMQLKITEYESELEALRMVVSDNSNSSTQAEALNKTIEENEIRITELEDELQKRAALAEGETEKAQATQSKITEYESELEALRLVVADNSNNSTQTEALNQTIEENEKALAQIKKELENASSKASEHELEIEDLKATNKDLIDQLNSMPTSDPAANEENEKRIASLENQIAETEKALADLDYESQKRIESLEKQVAENASSGTDDESQKRIESLERQIADTEEALAEIILAKDKLEDKLASS